MTQYATGNPVGSVDVKDLFDNAQNLDHLVNDQTTVDWQDRFGQLRKTWWGLEQDVYNFLLNSQFEYPPLNYVDGTPLTVLRPTQLIQRAGQLYRIRLPSAFPVNLSGVWATDESLLSATSDTSLRQDLANTINLALGAALVGYRGRTVTDKLDSGEVSLEDFGGKANDTTFDNTAALLAAAATGRQIRINDGKTYSFLTAVAVSQNVRLVGNGTIQIRHNTYPAMVFSGKFYSEGVNYDGVNLCGFGVRCTGSRAEIIGGSMKNFFTSTAGQGALAFATVATDFVRVRNVEFDHICSPANGTVGDEGGTAAAVQIGDKCASGLIEGCTFNDINNRATAGGTLQFEDADAIRQFSTVNAQSVTVRDCRFTDCGKRCLKSLVPNGSVTKFYGNKVQSAWTGTPDNSGAFGNGMSAVVSSFGGHMFVYDNEFSGGVCQFFVDATGTAVRYLKVWDNVYSPEFHKYVNTSMTRFVYTGTGLDGPLDATAKLEVGGNTVTNVQVGVGSSSKTTVMSSNSIESGGPGADVVGGGTLTVLGGTFTQRSGSDPAVEGGYGVRVGATINAFTVSGVVFNGKNDGVYVATQTAAFKGAVGNCTFINLVRADVFYQTAGDTASVSQIGNASPAGNPDTSMLVATIATATAGAATLPSAPAGFLRIKVNGTERRLPFYQT